MTPCAATPGAGEAGRPTAGGGSGPGNVEVGGGGGYMLLAAAHAGAAAACFLDPTAVGNFFFGGENQFRDVWVEATECGACVAVLLPSWCPPSN